MSQHAVSPAVSPVEPPPLPHDATQDEIDEHWLRHVYKPDAPQLTVRAIVAGMFLGGVMSVSNLYIGLKVGWSLGMAITATILAFSLFAVLRKIGAVRSEFTKLENNTVASCASAAGYFSSAGMVSAVPALYLTQDRLLTPIEVAIWMSVISLLGILIAVPMRRQMIDIDRLPFPSGLAGAETIKAMHEHAGEALSKARSLLYGALLAALFEIPYQVGSFGRWRNPITWPEHLMVPGSVGGYTIGSLGLQLNTSLLMYGAGAIIGVRVGASMLVGAVFLWVGMGPWLAGHGITSPGAGIFRSMTNWSVWPGVLMVIVAGLLNFALKWRTIASAFGSLGKIIAPNARPSKMAPVEVPPSWFGWGLLVATALVAGVARIMFGIPLWMGVLAAAVGFVLSIVACRSMGETDIAPLGPLGKIAQFIYAGVHPGHYPTNLMSASVTAGSAAHSSDLLTDLKTGYLLGGSPRRQFLAQLFGIVAGAFFCGPAYLLLVRPEKIASADLPTPAAQQWAAVADLLAHGIRFEARGAGTARAVPVEALALTGRPSGIAVGDRLRIVEGPNAGVYAIAMIDRTTIVVDRPVPQARAGPGAFRAEVVAPDGTVRGATAVRGDAVARAGIELLSRPDGTQVGDYVMARVDGVDVWHRIMGVRGDVAMLDHAFAARGDAAIEVHKMGLPPYALQVTFVTIAVALLITLLEVYGPRRLRRWLPSVTGFGMAWVIGCWDSVAIGIGSVIAFGIGRISPRTDERYTVSTSSGIIAGASIMSIVLIALGLLGVIGPVE
ncbi:MAG TPA: OPT family oligopeptide transporter [Haliangiales bacterium]|nr:OPT family oligopeptide transporter [Haliangiales bacterium]